MFASKIALTVFNSVTDLATAMVMASTNSGAIAATNNFTQPLAKWIHVPCNYYGAPVKKVKMYCSAARVYGIKPREIIDEEDYGSLVDAAPAKPWYWHVIQQNVPSSNINMDYTVQISYYVVFYGRVDSV